MATNLQSVNNATSTKCNKARYARTGNERGAITTDSIKRIKSYVMNNFMPIKRTISMRQTKFLKRHKTTKVNAEKQIISKGLYLSKILNL